MYFIVGIHLEVDNVYHYKAARKKCTKQHREKCKQITPKYLMVSVTLLVWHSKGARRDMILILDTNDFLSEFARYFPILNKTLVIKCLAVFKEWLLVNKMHGSCYIIGSP